MIQEEHWKLDKQGEIEGVFVVDPTKAKGADLWQKIDEVIVAYTQLHPVEMEAQVRSNVLRMKEQLNEFGSTKDKSLRWGASIPTALLFRLQILEPELFENKRLFNTFLKKYKGFAVCKRI